MKKIVNRVASRFARNLVGKQLPRELVKQVEKLLSGPKFIAHDKVYEEVEEVAYQYYWDELVKEVGEDDADYLDSEDDARRAMDDLMALAEKIRSKQIWEKDYFNAIMKAVKRAGFTLWKTFDAKSWDQGFVIWVENDGESYKPLKVSSWRYESRDELHVDVELDGAFEVGKTIVRVGPKGKRSDVTKLAKWAVKTLEKGMTSDDIEYDDFDDEW